MDDKFKIDENHKFTYRIIDDKKTGHVIGQVVCKMKQLDGTFKEVVFPNKVTVQGLQHIVTSIYNGITPKLNSKEFETELFATDEDNTKSKVTVKAGPAKIIGLNLAKNGANGGDIIPFKRHLDGFNANLDDLIPWRTVLLSQNDWVKYKQIYLHHRIVTISGIKYVEYFTKKVAFRDFYKTDDGHDIPANHGQTLNTDKDCRAYVECDINVSSDELQEHFRLKHIGGTDGTSFSASLLMLGYPAEILLDGNKYETITKTKVFSRCNHVNLYHGSAGLIDVKYEVNHV